MSSSILLGLKTLVLQFFLTALKTRASLEI